MRIDHEESTEEVPGPSFTGIRTSDDGPKSLVRCPMLEATELQAWGWPGDKGAPGGTVGALVPCI